MTLPYGATTTPTTEPPAAGTKPHLSRDKTPNPAPAPTGTADRPSAGRTAARLILAIDPGSTHSGVALVEAGTCRPVMVAKMPNAEVLDLVRHTRYDHLAIEMIASYGMAVGKEVFDTCVWIGRFVQKHLEWRDAWRNGELATHALVYRRDVKLHHCHSAKAKDANITQALVDRFAYGEPNRGKGTKASPGWFHGFAADMWQAYALAVHASDTLNCNTPPVTRPFTA